MQRAPESFQSRFRSCNPLNLDMKWLVLARIRSSTKFLHVRFSSQVTGKKVPHNVIDWFSIVSLIIIYFNTSRPFALLVLRAAVSARLRLRIINAASNRCTCWALNFSSAFSSQRRVSSLFSNPQLFSFRSIFAPGHSLAPLFVELYPFSVRLLYEERWWHRIALSKGSN